MFKSIKRSPTNTSWHSIYSFPIIEEVPQSIPDFSSHYFSPYSSKLITKTIEMIFSLYSKIKKKQIPNHRHCIKPKLKDRNQLTTRIIYNLWEFFLNLLLIAIHMLVPDFHIPLNSMVKLAAFQTVIIFCLS